MKLRKNPILYGSIFSFLFSLPLFVSARTIRSVAKNIAKFLLGPLFGFLIVLSLVLFIWGLIEFMRNAENSDKRREGKTKIIWGILALFVLLSFISITGIFTNTLFQSNPILPQFYES